LKDTKKSTIILLWLIGFFGILNLHNFYANRRKTGFIKTVLLSDVIAAALDGTRTHNLITIGLAALLAFALVISSIAELIAIIRNKDLTAKAINKKTLWLLIGFFVSNALILASLTVLQTPISRILYIIGCLALALTAYKLRADKKDNAETPNEASSEPQGNMYTQNYDIFLSYRRDGGEAMAILLRDRLAEKGYDVFLDIEGLNSGGFNTQLLNVIDGCEDFVLICSKNALDRCATDGDWVRLEIARAFEQNKNIIPLMLRGFEFPEILPDDIEFLRLQNGVAADKNEYFDAAIDRLASKFLLSKPKAAAYKSKKNLISFRKALKFTPIVIAVAFIFLSGWQLYSNITGSVKKVTYTDDILVIEETVINNGNSIEGKRTAYFDGGSRIEEGTFDSDGYLIRGKETITNIEGTYKAISEGIFKSDISSPFKFSEIIEGKMTESEVINGKKTPLEGAVMIFISHDGSGGLNNTAPDGNYSIYSNRGGVITVSESGSSISKSVADWPDEWLSGTYWDENKSKSNRITFDGKTMIIYIRGNPITYNYDIYGSFMVCYSEFIDNEIYFLLSQDRESFREINTGGNINLVIWRKSE